MEVVFSNLINHGLYKNLLTMGDMDPQPENAISLKVGGKTFRVSEGGLNITLNHIEGSSKFMATALETSTIFHLARHLSRFTQNHIKISLPGNDKIGITFHRINFFQETCITKL